VLPRKPQKRRLPGRESALNRYNYAGTSPLSYTDPTGLNPEGPGGGFPGLPPELPPIFGGGGSSSGPIMSQRPDGDPQNAQIWDEYHIHFGANIGAALGLPSTGGCEFGVCHSDVPVFDVAPNTGGKSADWSKLISLSDIWQLFKYNLRLAAALGTPPPTPPCSVGVFGYLGYENAATHKFVGYLPEYDSKSGLSHNVLVEKGAYGAAAGTGGLKDAEGLYFIELTPNAGGLVAVSPSGGAIGAYGGDVIPKVNIGAGAGGYAAYTWRPCGGRVK
jgi:hypothetical protein